MVQLLLGERIARGGILRIGASATIFDASRTRIFLTQRHDNHLWVLPGGGMDAGESIAECCIREVWEETFLHVEIVRLMGVYSNPNAVIRYNDGNEFQIVGFNFEVRITEGSPQVSDEVAAFGYFTWAEMQTLDVMHHHRERLADAFRRETGAG